MILDSNIIIYSVKLEYLLFLRYLQRNQAITHNLPLLTHNVGDFADINGLTVIALADVLNA